MTATNESNSILNNNFEGTDLECSIESFRSLYMSQNMAYSVVDEVSHMIRVTSHDNTTLSSLDNGYNGNTRSYDKVTRQHPDLKVSRSYGGLPNSTSYYQTPSSTNIDNTFALKRTTSVGKRNDLLAGIVVSRWDNIVGPQCSYLWTEELTSTFYPGNLPTNLTRLVKYVTDHTVDHQDIDLQQHQQQNTTSFSILKVNVSVVSDLNLVYISLSIRIPPNEYSPPYDNALTIPHSISVLANLQYLQHFLLMRPLVISWLMEFSPKIGLLICKNKLHLSLINSWCAELCKTMAALRTCWWQRSLSDNTEVEASIDKKVAESNFNYLPPPVSKNYLELILTSHLTTSSSTIVVGNDAHLVNQMIRFLLCFSKAEEGYCSRYVLPIIPDTFMKGLYIQGLMAGEIGEKSISVNQVNSNRHPFTYVDLSSKVVKVRQMPVFNHSLQRENTLVQELSALWNSVPFTSPNTEIFSQTVTESAGFVSKLLSDLLILKREWRYGRVQMFRRLLHSKAIALITFVNSIKSKPYKERIQLIKSIKEVLNLDEREYLIIQMISEKIRPGILSFLRS